VLAGNLGTLAGRGCLRLGARMQVCLNSAELRKRQHPLIRSERRLLGRVSSGVQVNATFHPNKPVLNLRVI